MAATVNTSSIHADQGPGGKWIVTGEATLDAAYATGGEAFDLSSYVGADCRVIVSQIGVSVYDLAHDGGNASAGLITAKYSVNGVQAAANTNLAAVSFTFLAVGSAPA